MSGVRLLPATENQRWLAAHRSYQRSGRLSPWSRLGARLADTSISDASLQNCQTIHFRGLKAPAFGTLLQLPWEADTVTFQGQQDSRRPHRLIAGQSHLLRVQRSVVCCYRGWPWEQQQLTLLLLGLKCRLVFPFT